MVRRILKANENSSAERTLKQIETSTKSKLVEVPFGIEQRMDSADCHG
jgi:hypothetical protein